MRIVSEGIDDRETRHRATMLAGPHRHYGDLVTGRQMIVVFLTALVAVSIAGLVQHTAGWLFAAAALVVVALGGGTIGRYLNNP